MPLYKLLRYHILRHGTLFATTLFLKHRRSSSSFHFLFVDSFFNKSYTQDISVPDAVKIEDIDPSAVISGYEQARVAYSAAEAGSVAQAEAQIDMEMFRAVASAVGITVA